MFISFVYIAWGLCCIEIVDKKNHCVREAIRVLGGGGGALLSPLLFAVHETLGKKTYAPKY